MFNPLTIFVIAIVMAIVQISIFRALPLMVRAWLAYFPILAIMANFLGSMAILVFTGVASFVGISNLMSSIIFGGYIVAYKKARKLKREGIRITEGNFDQRGLF